jgi:hypothetical protein
MLSITVSITTQNEATIHVQRSNLMHADGTHSNALFQEPAAACLVKNNLYSHCFFKKSIYILLEVNEL